MSRRIRRYHDLDPDEIFLDSRGVPGFSKEQFEDIIERPISRFSLNLFSVFFLCVGLLLFGRTILLQAVRGTALAARSDENRLSHIAIPAPRGVIYDRVGDKIAWNEETGRAYSTKGGLGHVLGFTGLPNEKEAKNYLPDQIIGKEGVEAEFEEALGGIPGKKIVEESVAGKTVSESVLSPPVPGTPITLSVDDRLSSAMYQSLAKVAEEEGFQGGAGVLMDIYTGEILSMVSYPEYQSGVISSRTDTAAIRAYQNDSRKPFLNRVVQGVYTPGSIIKPYIAIGALEENIISPEKEILSTGSISIQNPYDPTKKTVFKDWKAHGWVNMRRAIAVSSNVYFYSVGGGFGDQPGLGIERINKYTRMFGFGTTTNSGFPGEASGLVPTPAWKEKTYDGEAWRLGDTYHTTIGQYGFQVTPLQVVRAVAAIANGGYLVTPNLTKTEETNESPKGVKLPVSDAHLQIVREGMHLGSIIGTGQALNLPFITVGVKTGTAELNVDKSGVNSWVTGFFPYEKPRYAFAMVLEKGKAGTTVGASYAARNFFEKVHLDAPEYLRATSTVSR
jgi:penicillin-binding protein 2